MKRIASIVAAGMAMAAGGSASWAHPGHGVIPADEPSHWLEPVHLLPVLGTAAMVAIAYRWLTNSGDDHGAR